MTAPSPAALLRHRPPALLLDTIEAVDDGAIHCTTRGPGPWAWERALEAAAQAAGLLAGLQPGGPSNRAVIAEYRDVVVHGSAARGPIHVRAWVERRVLGCWRCRIEARVGDRVLLEGHVTIAPGAR